MDRGRPLSARGTNAGGRAAAVGLRDRRHTGHRGVRVADRHGWALPRRGNRGDALERAHAAAYCARALREQRMTRRDDAGLLLSAICSQHTESIIRRAPDGVYMLGASLDCGIYY